MSDLLADLTTLRLGGPARRLVTATSTGELVELVRGADAAGERVLLVGGGSNLVIGDDGWDGVVVLVRSDAVSVDIREGTVAVTADAGVSWDSLVARSVDEGWSGLAAMSGIPGSTGGTPVQNVGAYGSEVADVISSVRVLDRETGGVEDWPAERCAFAFRTSAFKHTDRYVVLSVTFDLLLSDEAPPARYAELARRLEVEIGDTAPSARVREVVLDLRRSKGMVLDDRDPDTWSVGSFFVNMLVDEADVPPGCPHWPTDGRMKLSAAWLIENAGFGKGFGLDRPPGTVAVSTKHTLALTNRGGATTAQLLDLARLIRGGVEARYGLRLFPEAHLIGCAL
ncbi:UDP-N-acetylmuramate dehydrogenase [Jatrophihabitans endophyticus]|uniref:UDP-N-acetylmuramate dehydrogenase n=1 Tax=Jatrophihabitans endophyticus TaxID=1206085 RepID=UPI0019EF11C3|nr:UDP-N-acetylmuramate dehydrogenase [Jatrophihabitans endophyticus]MBE7190821.1 UDP-N-acetylmuramate dehydrogenase [Jatrophihabitans endophyticus]